VRQRRAGRSRRTKLASRIAAIKEQYKTIFAAFYVLRDDTLV
jgi:hypothetical protein